MNVCDRCKKEKVKVKLKFVTKEFELCEKCAGKIVSWIEDKPLGEKFKELGKNSFDKVNAWSVGI